MLVTEYIRVSLHSNTISYYEKLNYIIPRYKDKDGRMSVKKGTTILVKVLDLPKSSQVNILYFCDYCLDYKDKTLLFATYQKYNKSRVIIEKDCCDKCKQIKTRESFQLKYGEDSLGKVRVKNGYKKAFLDGNIVVDIFIKHGFKPLFSAEDYVSAHKKLLCICLTHPEQGIIKVSYANVYSNKGCRLCGNEKISGENSPFWKGGLTPIYEFLRAKILEWKRESMKQCDYKCILTKQKFSAVHHLYSFNKIVLEVLEDINIELKLTVLDYTNEELELIEQQFILIHNKYPLGVCLTKNIHDLYHNLYGNDNTPEQFEEFTKRYQLGEFSLLNK